MKCILVTVSSTSLQSTEVGAGRASSTWGMEVGMVVVWQRVRAILDGHPPSAVEHGKSPLRSLPQLWLVRF
jgi:hypothetical protein